MKGVPFLVLTFACFLSACDDPAASKPKAQTSEPASNIAVAPAGFKSTAVSSYKPVGTPFVIEPSSSKVEFTGSKVTGSHEGGFKAFTGVIDLIGEKAETSRVLVEIDMSSVFSDADGLTKHLQTGDFFEVSKYPTATFVSTRITPDTAGGPDRFTVTGDLEIRGVKKSITFPATINIDPTDVSVNAEFSIDRKDFGIVYAGKADDLIRDGVVIRLNLRSARKI